MKSPGKRLALVAAVLVAGSVLAVVISTLGDDAGGANPAVVTASALPVVEAEPVRPAAADTPHPAAAARTSSARKARTSSAPQVSARLPVPAETTEVATTALSRDVGRPFALAPTRRCLSSKGAEVSVIRSANSRLRALGDLAQRTSISVVLDGRILGLAFGDARLLESLMRVPDDPYLLEVRRNVLLMFRPSAGTQAKVIRGCLR